MRSHKGLGGSEIGVGSSEGKVKRTERFDGALLLPTSKASATAGAWSWGGLGLRACCAAAS